MRDCTWIVNRFENLTQAGFDDIRDCTSDRTEGTIGDYNCIAWAAGQKGEWWWPFDIGGYTWPVWGGAWYERNGHETIENFKAAFKAIGYLECKNGKIQKGYEKVAIYVDSRGRPTHAARSLPNGVWTSKLGGGEDIEHSTYEAIGGRKYGTAEAFMRRRLKTCQKPNKLKTFLSRLLSIFRRP